MITNSIHKKNEYSKKVIQKHKKSRERNRLFYVAADRLQGEEKEYGIIKREDTKLEVVFFANFVDFNRTMFSNGFFSSQANENRS